MNYYEYTFENVANEELAGILIARLDLLGFEGFVEEGARVQAYVSDDKDNNAGLKDIVSSIDEDISFSCTLIPETNWNAKWESDFKAVEVDDDVIIRASFHDINKTFTYDLLIDPKMSFGTGHHETTRLMVKAMMKIDFSEKKVLDMGSGTGVLAILASKLGAREIDAIDIDDWAVTNAKENFAKNKTDNIKVWKGDVSSVSDKYDIILANINRNVLLSDMKAYTQAMNANSMLIISGFMLQDEEVILTLTKDLGLTQRSLIKEHSWLSAVLQK